MQIPLKSDFLKTGLQQEQPPLYENLTKILNPDEQQMFQYIVQRADQIAIAQAAESQAAAAATGTAGHQQQINGGAH
jgi:hypothetical protein